MMNLEELEKDYEVFYNPIEGYKYLYLGRKNDPEEVLKIFSPLKLSEAIRIAKQNKSEIRCSTDYPEEDNELKNVCKEINLNYVRC